jgi:hypothetical protein
MERKERKKHGRADGRTVGWKDGRMEGRNMEGLKELRIVGCKEGWKEGKK